MTDPLTIAADIERKSYVEGLWFEVDIAGTDVKLVAAALRLASTVDRAEIRRRERTCGDHLGLDRDEADALDDFRKARGA